MFKINVGKTNVILTTVLLGAGVIIASNFYTVGGQEERYESLKREYETLKKDSLLNVEMITRFVELSDPPVIQKIKDEFEFDMITRPIFIEKEP